MQSNYKLSTKAIQVNVFNRNTKEIEQTTGYKLILNDYPDLQLAVTVSIDNDQKFTVTELQTGCLFVKPLATKTEAIRATIERIKISGLAKVQELIKQAQDQYQLNGLNQSR